MEWDGVPAGFHGVGRLSLRNHVVVDLARGEKVELLADSEALQGRFDRYVWEGGELGHQPVPVPGAGEEDERAWGAAPFFTDTFEDSICPGRAFGGCFLVEGFVVWLDSVAGQDEAVFRGEHGPFVARFFGEAHRFAE